MSSHTAAPSLRPLDATAPARDDLSVLVSPQSPRRLDGTSGKQSPGSPLRIGRDLPMSSSTEYRDKFSAAAAVGPVKRAGARAASSSELWLSIGEPQYSTETKDKFTGHQPPPPAARPVPKYEPNTLPFHDRTIYRESFQGVAASRPEVYRPKQQTESLPVPLQSATEYRDAFPKRPLSPTKTIQRSDWRAAEKPFFGVTQYGEAFTGEAPKAPAPATPERLATSLRASARRTGALSRTGGAHLTSTATSYNDVDGPGANPWKLMETLGLPPGDLTATRRGSAAAGASSSPLK